MREHADLRTTLRHRHPNLLVDRVTAEEPGVRIQTLKAISGCEPCYRGLSDDAPPVAYEYPVVLILESLIQSAALLWATRRAGGPDLHAETLVLASVRGVRCHRAALPGDVLRHTVELSSVVGSNVFATGGTTLGDGTGVLSVASLVLSTRAGDWLRHSS